MNRSFIRGALALVALAVIATACGARQPSPVRAQHLIERYFHRYAKKFPESDLGRQPVAQVAIGPMEELHKHYVMITTDVKPSGGPGFKALVALEKTYPRGWKVVAWERLGTPTPIQQQ